MKKKSFFLFLSLVLWVGVSEAGTVEDHLLSGSKFAQDKKYSEAAREFETAVTLDPKNAEANLLLGLTLANTGDLDRAVQYSNAAVQLKPTYSGYYNLGLIYANQGKYDQAVEAYEKAVQLNASSYQTWYDMGRVYSQALKFDKAIEAYRKAIELNPKFPGAYQGLGSANFWLGNADAAREQVAKMKELGMDAKAQELENWIKDKEAKKKAAAQKGPKA